MSIHNPYLTGIGQLKSHGYFVPEILYLCHYLKQGITQKSTMSNSGFFQTK